MRWCRRFLEWFFAPKPDFRWEGMLLRLREIERKERAKREREMFDLARKLGRRW